MINRSARPDMEVSKERIWTQLTDEAATLVHQGSAIAVLEEKVPFELLHSLSNRLLG